MSSHISFCDHGLPRSCTHNCDDVCSSSDHTYYCGDIHRSLTIDSLPYCSEQFSSISYNFYSYYSPSIHAHIPLIYDDRCMKKVARSDKILCTNNRESIQKLSHCSGNVHLSSPFLIWCEYCKNFAFNRRVSRQYSCF